MSHPALAALPLLFGPKVHPCCLRPAHPDFQMMVPQRQEPHPSEPPHSHFERVFDPPLPLEPAGLGLSLSVLHVLVASMPVDGLTVVLLGVLESRTLRLPCL